MSEWLTLESNELPAIEKNSNYLQENELNNPFDFEMANEYPLSSILQSTPLGLSEFAEDWSEIFNEKNKDPDPELIKRLERNRSEQRRAKKISQQIDEIHSLLKNSSFPLESTSKLHILYGCEKYIKELEHKINKIGHERILSTLPTKRNLSDTYPNIEFKSDYVISFEYSIIPMAISSISGDIIKSNKYFKKVLNVSDEFLTDKSIFTLIDPDYLSNFYCEISELINNHHLNSNINKTKDSVSAPVYFNFFSLQM